MKLTSSILLFVFLILFSCKEPSPGSADKDKVTSVSKKAVKGYQNNCKTLNLSGKVKAITCTHYEQFVPDSELQLLITKQDYKFDKRGNVTEEVVFLEKGKFDRKHLYFYDRMGNCLRKKVYKQDGTLSYTEDTVLDEQGGFVSEKYRQKGMEREYSHKYETVSDSLVVYGMITTEKRATGIKTDTLTIRQEFRNGNKVKETYASGKSRGWVEEFRYDDRNNLIYQSNSGVHFMYWEFEYDDKNRQISWFVHNDANSMTRQIKREFDAYGNVTKEVSHVNGAFTNVESFTAVYVYDSHNNWIKRSRFRLNGSKISVLERQITYY